MSQDIDKIIAEVERLDREATPGPWRVQQGEYSAPEVTSDSGWIVSQGCTDCCQYGEPSVSLNLITHYRTAAPLLAAEVKRLRAGGCARDQRTTQFCAEAVARDADIAKLRDQILDYQQKLHVAEQEIARLRGTMIEPTEQTGDEDSEQ